jgi:hypothetical protein
MAYFEYLRVRTSFLIFAAVVVVLALFVYLIAALHSAQIDVGMSRHRLHAPPGLSILFFASFAAWGTAILATVISASLNRQREHLAYTWTRPERREATALSFVAIDVASLLAAFVLIIAVALACYFAVIGNRFPIIWKDAVPDLLRAFGFALMWYAIVQAATAWGSFRGGIVAGISWPVFIFLAGLLASHFPSPWGEVIRAVNVLNPMAYLSGTHVSARTGDVVMHSLLPFDATTRLALMYGIAAIALVVAVLSWRRMEV